MTLFSHALIVSLLAAAPAQPTAKLLKRGEALKGLPQTTLAAIVSAPEKHSGKTVAIEANVRQACQKKGCWMELSDDKGSAVRVTFKDYGFFVPLDAAGSKAKVEGVIEVKELSDAKAKHYEEEGATVPRGADGKAREVRLIAYGVELSR